MKLVRFDEMNNFLTIYSMDLKTCFVMEGRHYGWTRLSDKLGTNSFVMCEINNYSSTFDIIVDGLSALRYDNRVGINEKYMKLSDDKEVMQDITEDEFNQLLKGFIFTIDISRFLDDNDT